MLRRQAVNLIASRATLRQPAGLEIHGHGTIMDAASNLKSTRLQAAVLRLQGYKIVQLT